jgi:hypothetical protein
MIYQSGVSYSSCKTVAGNYIDLGSCGTIECYQKHCEVTETIKVSISDFNILSLVVGHLVCTGVQLKFSQTTG